jgi:hypothetical protein
VHSSRRSVGAQYPYMRYCTVLYCTCYCIVRITRRTVQHGSTGSFCNRQKMASKKKRRGDGAGGKKAADAQRDLIRIKITSCGEGGVGKSCIIKRYCEEKFVSRYIAVSVHGGVLLGVFGAFWTKKRSIFCADKRSQMRRREGRAERAWSATSGTPCCRGWARGIYHREAGACRGRGLWHGGGSGRELRVGYSYRQPVWVEFVCARRSRGADSALRGFYVALPAVSTRAPDGCSRARPRSLSVVPVSLSPLPSL